MGTPQFAVVILEELLKDENFNIKLVITQPDKPVGRKQILTPPPIKEIAQKFDIPILQPERLKSNIEVYNALKTVDPDVIVVVAYGKILPKEILQIPRYGCINVHASLLPEYRGASPIHRVLMDGKDYTGVTIMKMDEGLDTGDILMQEKIPIDFTEDIISLSEKLSFLGAKILIKALKDFNNLKPQKQDEACASYAPPIKKEEGKITWDMSYIEICNRFRALKIWPGIYTIFKNKILKIHDIEIKKLENMDHILNGTVVEIENDSINIKVKDGIIKIKKLQIEGGKKVSAKDFVNGYKIKRGDIFI